MSSSTAKALTLDQRKAHHDACGIAFWSLFFAALFLFMPDMAHAADPIGSRLCTVVSALQGTTAKVIATIAIIVLGLGALFGKISWGMAIMVILGIILIFGAGTLLSVLGYSPGDCAVGQS